MLALSRACPRVSPCNSSKLIDYYYISIEQIYLMEMRWFKEKWATQSGSRSYIRKGDLFRPTVRVNSKTPVTWSELTPREIRAARREKRKTGRVKKFKP